MKRIRCTRVFEIAYAHNLPKHEGKCCNEHGHNARLEVTLEGAVNRETGMIMDFVDMKKILEPVINLYDHRHLNKIKRLESIRRSFLPNPDCFIFTENHPPTAENFAAWLMEDINEALRVYFKPEDPRMKCPVTCVEIKMWETANCFVSVTEEEMRDVPC